MAMNIVCMDKGIGVTFGIFAAIQRAFAGSAKSTLAFFIPAMLCAFKPDISCLRLKRARHAMLAIGMFGTIEAPPREQGGKLRDADAKNLPRQDVIDAGMQIGKFIR